jgi:hypothetical protein
MTPVRLTHFVVFILSVLFLSSSMDAKSMQTRNSPALKSNSAEYKRLATYCFIDDYPAWLRRQQELMIWLDLAKILKLPIQDDKQFQQELQQYRLQYECLRVMERLPVAVGPG